MQFDTVLTQADAAGILDEVVAITAHRTIRARGVSQSGSTGTQFVAELDSTTMEWHMVTDTGHRYPTEDGGMMYPVQLLHPAHLPMWGRPNESFFPILAQRIGTHSILLTLEHVHDPAFRATLVIDTAVGAVIRTSVLGDVTILTEVDVDRPLARRTDYEFEPITDWIRLDY